MSLYRGPGYGATVTANRGAVLTAAHCTLFCIRKRFRLTFSYYKLNVTLFKVQTPLSSFDDGTTELQIKIRMFTLCNNVDNII